jgi:fido (protein-threonine AMPylation protein)
LVIDEGLSVGGRTLREHLEAVDHAKALDWVLDWVAQRRPVDQAALLALHACVLHGSHPEQAGQIRQVPVRISGSRSVLPAPVKVPKLMEELGAFLKAGPRDLHPAAFAAEAHLRLVSIHPFVDGNGRTARLLLNLLLLRAGYPIAVIRLRDRLRYLSALESVQTGGPRDDYDRLIFEACDRGLDLWLDAAAGRPPKAVAASARNKMRPNGLWRIGQLAEACSESVSTLRHWTKMGLLPAAGSTEKGYTLYEPSSVERVRQIRRLQSQRLSLEEVARRLKV